MGPGDTPGGPAHGSPVVGPSGSPMMMADLDATDDDADKSEKWRRVVHSNELSGLKMDQRLIIATITPHHWIIVPIFSVAN